MTSLHRRITDQVPIRAFHTPVGPMRPLAVAFVTSQVVTSTGLHRDTHEAAAPPPVAAVTERSRWPRRVQIGQSGVPDLASATQSP